MSKTMYLGAGAALALSLVMPTAANAQKMTPEEVRRNLAIAEENGVAPYVLTPNDRDKYGRPYSDTALEAYRELGSWEAVRLASLDGARFCTGQEQVAALKDEIRAADLLVKQADEAAARAQSEAERKAAAAQQTRARSNFLRLLVTGVKLGLVSQIPGVGWAYGGYIVAHEFDAYLQRAQHSKEMESYDANVDANDARIYAMSLRLKALDKRNELSDMRGELYDASMRAWCDSMKQYHARLAPISATYKPYVAPAGEPTSPPAEPKPPKDW